MLSYLLGEKKISREIVTEIIYSGSAQYFMVPPGVTLLDVSLTGASGGSAINGPWFLATAYGGRGSVISCTIPVIPGDIYQVNIGGTGEYAGVAGWNGGGTGGRCMESGGGGGSTDLRNGSYDITDRLVVAGGGGGGERYGSANGGDGGYPEGSRGDGGRDTTDGVFPGGGGGTQSTGGFTSIAGLSGRLFYGSDEAPFYNCLVGGGGGGYYGGGAAKYAGGGGGSSYCITKITKNTISTERNANGKVVIRYEYLDTTPPSVEPSSSASSATPSPSAGGSIDKSTSSQHLDASSSFTPSTSPTPIHTPRLLSPSAAPSKALHLYRTAHPTTYSFPTANSTIALSNLLPSTITTSVPSILDPFPLLSPAPTSSHPKLDELSTSSLNGLVVVYFTSLITFMYVIFPIILRVTG